MLVYHACDVYVTDAFDWSRLLVWHPQRRNVASSADIIDDDLVKSHPRVVAASHDNLLHLLHDDELPGLVPEGRSSCANLRQTKTDRATRDGGRVYYRLQNQRDPWFNKH